MFGGQSSNQFLFGGQVGQPVYGGQQQPAAAQQPQTSSLFGQQTLTNRFNSQQQTAPQSSLFSQQPVGTACQPQSSLFGPTSPQGSRFGLQQTPTAQTSVFGQQQVSTPLGQTSLFGQQSTQQPQQQQTSLFGQQSTQQPQQQQTSLFGQTTTNLFGQQQQQPTTPSSLFGQQGSLFRPQTQSSLFSSQPLFGSQPPPQLFGGTQGGVPVEVTASSLQTQQQLQDLHARLQRSPAIRDALGRLTNPDEAAAYRLVDIYERIQQLKSITPDLVRFKWSLALVPEAAAQMEAELLQLKNNPQLLSWAALWVEANPNPNPNAYHLKVINGFEDLIAHGLEKKRQFELLSRGLENIHERQRKIREELDYDVKQRLTMIRKKHWGLKAKFLRCLGLLEDFAHQNQTAAIHADLVRQLDAGMHNFQTELIGSGVRTHADTLRQRMWQIAQRAAPRPGKRQVEQETLLGLLNERDVESIIDITDRQNDAFEALRKQTELDSKTVTVMVTALQNKSPSQYKPRGYRY